MPLPFLFAFSILLNDIYPVVLALMHEVFSCNTSRKNAKLLLYIEPIYSIRLVSGQNRWRVKSAQIGKNEPGLNRKICMKLNESQSLIDFIIDENDR